MTTSRAASSGHALVGAPERRTPPRTARVAASVSGSMTAAAEMSSCSCVARARTTAGSPSSVRSTTSRRSSVSAARRTRSSLPSGSTMCMRSARARSSSSYSNISGVQHVGVRGGDPVEQLRAVDVLVEQLQRRVDLARGLGSDLADGGAGQMGGRVGGLLGQHHRERGVKTLDQAQELVGGAQPAGQYHPGQRRQRPRGVRHQHAEHDVGPVTAGDHDRTVGEAVEQVGQRHRGDDERRRLEPECRRIAADQLARAGLQQIGDGRRRQQPDLGQDVHRWLVTAEPRRISRRRAPARRGWRIPPRRRSPPRARDSSASSMAAITSSSDRPAPDTTHTAGMPRFAATRALNASSPDTPTSVKSVPTASTASQSRASAL